MTLNDDDKLAITTMRQFGKLSDPEAVLKYALMKLSKRKQGIGKDDSELYYNKDKPITLPFADDSYFVLELDPPWSYNSIGFNGWENDKDYRIHPGYPTMPMSHLINIGGEVSRVMKPVSCVYCWVTDDFVIDGHVLLAAMGYQVVRMLHWIKTNKEGVPTFGQGYWYRLGWEGLLFGIRFDKAEDKRLLRPKYASNTANHFEAPDCGVVDNGVELINEVAPINGASTSNIIFAQKTGHSIKPPEAYELIRMNHKGPRLSIFQRSKRLGFDCWGNEIDLREMEKK